MSQDSMIDLEHNIFILFVESNSENEQKFSPFDFLTMAEIKVGDLSTLTDFRHCQLISPRFPNEYR